MKHSRWAVQRLVRGWDDRATYSLDVHLTRTLGAQLEHLAATSHGWPDTLYDTYEDWTQALRENAAALNAYAATVFDPESDTVEFTDSPDVIPGEQQLQKAREALKWVSEVLPHLWD